MARKPVIFEVVGDSYSGGGVIEGILWISPGSTAGDRVSLLYSDNSRLWESVTDSTNTYIGAFSMGLIVPQNGFKCGRLDTGRIYIYFREKF